MLKTLVDCKPSEFLRQTNRVRKSAEKWLKDTDIGNIRRRKPAYETAPAGASKDERVEVVRRNAAAERAQARENFSAILDAVLEEHPDETLELLAMCCFVEPEDVDEHTVSEYIAAFDKMLGDEAVMGFFTSLARLGQTDISRRSSQ